LNLLFCCKLFCIWYNIRGQRTLLQLCYQNLEGMSRINMIGDNVKKIRKKKGFTQDNLARKADIPYTTLTKLESNVVKKPSVQTVAKIAKALGISIEDLLK